MSHLGLGFGLSCTIGYTCARTLSLYYNYDALKTAFVLLFYGIGRYCKILKHASTNVSV